jgi:hypothetical protein
MNAFYFLTARTMHGPYCFATASGVACGIRRAWYRFGRSCTDLPVRMPIIIDATALLEPEQLARVGRDAPADEGGAT